MSENEFESFNLRARLLRLLSRRQRRLQKILNLAANLATHGTDGREATARSTGDETQQVFAVGPLGVGLFLRLTQISKISATEI
jgi:hypothetical protein